ncbi:hypothetical protein FCV25MIE_31661 [Fagus crenata]
MDLGHATHVAGVSGGSNGGGVVVGVLNSVQSPRKSIISTIEVLFRHQLSLHSDLLSLFSVPSPLSPWSCSASRHQSLSPATSTIINSDTRVEFEVLDLENITIASESLWLWKL